VNQGFSLYFGISPFNQLRNNVQYEYHIGIALLMGERGWLDILVGITADFDSSGQRAVRTLPESLLVHWTAPPSRFGTNTD
jgi:hypothetical protein